MFKTIEHIKARDSAATQHGLEVVLEQESDNVWRVIQERVLTDKEVAHDGVLDTA